MSSTNVFPRVVLLGTGAAANPLRCNTCIAIQTSPRHTLLLDTGSGVEVVRNLLHAGISLVSVEDVFLSHRHSDHIGGLELLMLHCGLHALQTGHHARELDIHGHHSVLDTAQTLVTSMGSVAPTLFGQMGERLDWLALAPGEAVTVHSGVRLLPFVVDHVPPAGSCWGCVVEIDVKEPSGTAQRTAHRQVRVVFTGDTRPTPELEHYARGADLLLHECGGLEANAEHVHRVGHCTAADAGRLAQRAGVQRLVLTHIPDDALAEALADEAQRSYEGPVSAARDFDAFELA